MDGIIPRNEAAILRPVQMAAASRLKLLAEEFSAQLPQPWYCHTLLLQRILRLTFFFLPVDASRRTQPILRWIFMKMSMCGWQVPGLSPVSPQGLATQARMICTRGFNLRDNYSLSFTEEAAALTRHLSWQGWDVPYGPWLRLIKFLFDSQPPQVTFCQDYGLLQQAFRDSSGFWYLQSVPGASLNTLSANGIL